MLESLDSVNTYAQILSSTPIILSHHHFTDNGVHGTYSMQESLSQSYGVVLSDKCVGQSLLSNMQSSAGSVM